MGFSFGISDKDGNNEYYLGIIGSSAKDKVSIIDSYGDLHFCVQDENL